MRRIFVNGTFDILHLGHIELLRYAKSQGDLLIVGIDSDQRVNRLKGAYRPINNQIERQAMLEAIKYVDEVQVFDSDQELCDLIASCDIMVKGSDYQHRPIVGGDLCPVLFFERIDGYSTTEKIQRVVAGR